MIGDYRNEKKVYQQAERIFPDNPFLLWRQALFAFCQKKTKEAQSITDKFILISKQNSVTEATIAFHLGHLYWEAGMLDKAEESFRKMVALEPDASSGINPLSYFLIKSDRNIEEGIRLAEKVLAINLENFGGLRMKGWGLYKQGRYKEAFNLLDKSWNLRMKQAVYDHEAWLNLEAARKAVGEMK